MTESRITRKFRVYRDLYHVNNAFRYLESNLEALLADDLIERDSAEVWRSRLGELQAEINRNLTGHLHQRESLEVRHFAPQVEAWEEREIAKATARAPKQRKTAGRKP